MIEIDAIMPKVQAWAFQYEPDEVKTIRDALQSVGVELVREFERADRLPEFKALENSFQSALGTLVGLALVYRKHESELGFRVRELFERLRDFSDPWYKDMNAMERQTVKLMLATLDNM